MKWWKVCLAVIVLSAPLLVYICFFGGYSISDNPADWGAFGDYIGGVYTVLVTFFAIYLTRHLEKRDAVRNKAKTAVGAIYEQIVKIDYNHVDMRKVSKLLRLTKENELYITPSLFVHLTDLHDDYFEAKHDPKKFDIQKEETIKKELKRLYDA